MAKVMVDEKIKGKKVMVFSKSYCPFCTKAKKVLQKYVASGVLSLEDYEILEIEERPDCQEIQEHMKSITGGSSVPRVFINGKFAGGGDDMVALDSAGKLKGMIQG